VSLIARELDDDGVRKVGLKLERLGNVLVRRPWLARLLPRRFVAR
jgi:cell volume regulation protein A